MFELETTTATEAKTHFGILMDRSRKTPVLIQKNKRDHSVLLSIDDFEDMILTIKAYWAIEEGFIGLEESEKILNTYRNAQN